MDGGFDDAAPVGENLPARPGRSFRPGRFACDVLRRRWKRRKPFHRRLDQANYALRPGQVGYAPKNWCMYPG